MNARRKKNRFQAFAWRMEKSALRNPIVELRCEIDKDTAIPFNVTTLASGEQILFPTMGFGGHMDSRAGILIKSE